MAAGVSGSTILVSLVSVLSVCMSLLNQVVLAQYYGTSEELDGFLIAGAIPSVFSGMCLTLFGAGLIPALTRLRTKPEELSAALSSVTVLTLGGTILFVFVGVVWKNEILLWSTDLVENEFRVAGQLAGYIWLISGLSVVNSFFVSLHNFNKQFAVPAFLGLLPTIGMACGTVGLSRGYGIEGLVMGWLIAMSVSCCLLLPVEIVRRLSLKGVWMGRVHASNFFRALLPVAVGTLPFTILPAIDASWASQLPDGSVAVIGYCTRIAIGIASLVIGGIHAVILPYLADDVVRNDLESFERRMQVVFMYGLLLTIPVATFFIFFSGDIVSLFFQRGQFGEASKQGVASLLPFYLVGLIAMAPATILSRAYAALNQHIRFGLIGVGAVVIYYVLAGLLSARFSLYGIGMTYAFYWFLFLTVGLMTQRILIVDRYTLVVAAKSVGCAVVSSSLGALLFVHAFQSSPVVKMVLSACFVGGLFVVFCRWMGIKEMDTLKEYVVALARSC